MIVAQWLEQDDWHRASVGLDGELDQLCNLSFDVPYAQSSRHEVEVRMPMHLNLFVIDGTEWTTSALLSGRGCPRVAREQSIRNQ